MKLIFEWLKKNISTIFTFLGIFLTIYFSIFYIPSYVREMQNEKIKNINDSLIENLQELIYNNYTLEVDDIKSMIKGKELKYKISYPYSIEELLSLTRDDFLENKFIPLKERTKLISVLDSLKFQAVIIDSSKIVIQKRTTTTSIYSIITSLLGVLIAIAGFISAIFKLKKEKEIEIEMDVNKREDEIKYNVISGFKYEKLIENALSSLNLDFQTADVKGDFYGYDFFIKSKDKNFVIQAKYYIHGKKISTQTIHKLINIMSTIQANGILVTNVDLTQSAQNILNDYNSKNEEYPISIVIGEEKDELISKIRKIILT